MLKRFQKASLSATLILLAALGSVAFTGSAGFFVYRNTKALIAAEQWVEHSQEILSALQGASQRLDRLESSAQLFVEGHRSEQLVAARSAAISLGTSTVRLRSLVFDSPTQVDDVTRLGGCAQQLGRELEQFSLSDALPENTILKCRGILSRMSERERELLKTRTAASQKRSQRSVLSEAEMGFASLAVLLILFAFLFRDSLVRKRIEQQVSTANKELATTIRELESRAEESRLFLMARDELQLCMNLEQVYASAARALARLVAGSSGSFCILNNSRHLLETVAEWGTATTQQIFEPEACCALRSGRLRWRQPAASELHCEHFVADRPEVYFCLPLVAHGETLGVFTLVLPSLERNDHVRDREDSIRQLAELTAMTVAALQLRKKLENQSIRDSLTGLFNRHFMQIALERELARATRANDSLSIFMIDVDHFKQLNDRYGHATGDLLLKEISQVFQAKLRTEDIVCRYGGEEFAVILPEASAETAWNAAERVRQAVADLQVPAGNMVHSDLHVSIGVSLFPQDGATAEHLLKKADAALYRAKNEGRNQVTFA